MIRKGGIFSGPSGLGNIQGFGATGVSCSSTNTDLVRKIQTWLKANGAPLLKVDGSWEGCTASAWNKVTGTPFVMCDQLTKITGDECSSSTCFLNQSFLATAGLMSCNDGSDGARAAPGEQIQCAPGQCISALTGSCVTDVFGGLGCKAGTSVAAGGGGGTVNPPSGVCPAGTFGVPPNCIQNPLAPPPPNAPTCPSGTILLNGQCVGATGTTTPTTPPGSLTGQCPAGQIYIPFLGCQQNLLAPQPTGGGGVTPQATPPIMQTCPAGQISLPFVGCVANPFAAGGAATTIMGGGATTQTTVPGVLPGAAPESFWSKYWWAMMGVIAVGIGGVVYYRKKQQESLDLDLGMDSGSWGSGYYNSNCSTPNRRKRGRRRSRRRSRR